MAELMNNAIFWIDVDKIDANPYQPRKEFDDAALAELSDSIKQYGVLQPLVLSRQERQKPDGGLEVRYELIAGERRTRAARLAGLRQVPAIIRIGDDSKLKLELAIIENIQREDLNPVDRARAFLQLVDEFGLTHAQVGKKVGKSREYVSNSIRLLALPLEIIEGLGGKKISEGHTRPLLMLSDRPDEQMTLYKDIINRKMSVRDSEKYARRIAHEKIRREHLKTDPQIMDLERKFSEQLGTRVTIETGGNGGKLVIDYGDANQLEHLLDLFKKETMMNERNKQEAQENLTQHFTPQDVGFAPVVEDHATIFSSPIAEHEHNDLEKIVEEVEEIEKSYGMSDPADNEEAEDIAIAKAHLPIENPQNVFGISLEPEPEPEARELEEGSDMSDEEVDSVNTAEQDTRPL